MKLLIVLLSLGNIVISQTNNVVYFEKLNGEIKHYSIDIIRKNIDRDTSYWIEKSNDTLIYQRGGKTFKNNNTEIIGIQFHDDFIPKGFVVNFSKDSILISSENKINPELNKLHSYKLNDSKMIFKQKGNFELSMLETVLPRMDSIVNLNFFKDKKRRISLKKDNNEVFKYRFDKMNNLKSIKKLVNGKVVHKEKIKIYKKDKFGNWLAKYHEINNRIHFFYIRFIDYK